MLVFTVPGCYVEVCGTLGFIRLSLTQRLG